MKVTRIRTCVMGRAECGAWIRATVRCIGVLISIAAKIALNSRVSFLSAHQCCCLASSWSARASRHSASNKLTGSSDSIVLTAQSCGQLRSQVRLAPAPWQVGDKRACRRMVKRSLLRLRSAPLLACVRAMVRLNGFVAAACRWAKRDLARNRGR